MKKTEIEKGKHYAVGQNLHFPQSTAHRYKAIRTGVERRVGIKKARWSSSTDYPQDGVLMERITDEGKSTGITEVIRSHDIHAEWGIYVDWISTRDEAEIEKTKKFNKMNDETRKKLDKLIPPRSQPDSVKRLCVGDTTWSRKHYSGSPEDLVKLLETAVRHDRRKRNG